MMEGEDSESQDNKAFNNKSVWARISVVAAGPIFNFIMAFIFSFILVCCTGYDLPVLSDVSEGYAAEEAGLQADDTIVKMGNKHIHFYREVSAYSMYHAGEPVKVTYERDGERLHNGTQLQNMMRPPEYIYMDLLEWQPERRQQTMYSRWQNTVLTRWSTGSIRHLEA